MLPGCEISIKTGGVLNQFQSVDFDLLDFDLCLDWGRSATTASFSYPLLPTENSNSEIKYLRSFLYWHQQFLSNNFRSMFIDQAS